MYIVFRFRETTNSGLIDILIQAQMAILWDFLDALTRFLPIVRTWTDTILEINKIEFEVRTICGQNINPLSIYLEKSNMFEKFI